MKDVILISLLFLVGFSSLSSAQKGPDFFFQTGKPLCVLHFMHTAVGGEHYSASYQAYIDSNTVGDERFSELKTRYQALDFSASYRRPNLPQRRYRARSVMDLLWLRSSSASSLADFSIRSVGLLGVSEHAELFEVLAKAEEYYTRLVWDPQQANILRTERFLDAYEDRVAQLFYQVSTFYGTSWPSDIPFTVALCPIPLASGISSAVPKVNTLICSYLSENDEDYKATLGVAVHEMCHSIYDEQSASVQQDIDDWFTLSTDKVAPYAYAYFNEALATAIGNGWAYKQLNGKENEDAWYADEYIDGFAKAIYPLVRAYLREHQVLDRPFVDAAIEAFGMKFPNADRELAVILNSVGFYADAKDEDVLTGYTDQLFSRFRVASSYLRSPISSSGAISSFGYPQVTKVIIIDHDRAERWEQLSSFFREMKGLEMPQEANASFVFYNERSKSPVLIFLVNDAAGFAALMEAYKQDQYVSFGESLSLDLPE